MSNTIKLKQLDQTQLAAFINELIDGTGAVYTANRALVTDVSGDIVVSSTTSTEVGYLSGVTSAIQTQLNAKLSNSLTSAYIFVGDGTNTATGVAISGDISISNAGVVAISTGVIVNADINASAAIALSKLAATTASRALVSNASGFVSASSVTSTEIGYVSGVTSAIQTQLGNKQPLDATLTAFAALTIAADSVTLGTGADAFSQVTLSANTFLAKSSTGSAAAKTITDFGLSLVDDSSSSAALTTLGIGTANTVRFARLGLNVATSAEMLSIECDAATTKGVLIKGAASQSGNYLEAITSASAAVFKVASTGNVHLGVISASKAIVFSATATDARIESDGYTVDIRGRDSGQPVQIFTASGSSAAFIVSANYTVKYGQISTSSSAWTISGIVSRTGTNGSLTYTDTSSSGTVALVCLNSMSGQNIAASSATTFTNAATLYIDGIPIAGTNVTITNRLSLYTTGGIVSETQLKCSATTASSSVATGSGVFAGGVGIAGKLYVGSDLHLPGGATLLFTDTALTAGATGNVPTLTSGPVSGNPTKWIAISDNGTTRYIPVW